jgi:hypothetical protein
MLNLFAVTLILAEDQVAKPVVVETKKIVIDSDSVRSQKANLESSHKKLISGRSTRVLFITAKGCENCEKELNRLWKTGGDFEVMQSYGWKIGKEPTNHIQIVDREEFPDLVELLGVRQFPTVACIENGEIVRSFTEGCTTPLDVWTFGWLYKGQNERPASLSAVTEAARVETTGHYRLRGNHWTVEGQPNPSKEMVLAHLRGPNHGHAAPAYGSLETWSLEELRSLHDDLHEREGGTVGNFVYAQSGPIAANRNLEAFSGGRKVSGK